MLKNKYFKIDITVKWNTASMKIYKKVKLTKKEALYKNFININITQSSFKVNHNCFTACKFKKCYLKLRMDAN